MASVAPVAIACGGNSTPSGGNSPASNEPVTIRVSSQAGGTNAAFDQLAADFHKAYPNVTVKNEYLPIATYAQTVDTEFQAGNAPDVVYGSTGTGNANSLLLRAKAGQLVDLSNRSWAKEVPAGAKPLATLNNKLYMLPLNFVAVTAVYNVDLMQKNGWSPPQTYQQMLTLCQQAKAKGIAAWSIGGQFPTISGIVLASSIVYSDNPNWDADRAAGKVTFANSPTWRKTFERWVEINKSGCFPPGVSGMGIPQALSAVASGNALWYVAPAGVENSIKQINPNLKFSVFVIPGDTAASTRATAGWTDSIGVNAKGKNVAWALKYVDFVSQGKESDLVPAANDAMGFTQFHDKKVPDFLSPIKPFLTDDKKFVPVVNQGWPNGDVYTVMGQGMGGLLTGQLTVSQVLQNMDTAWNKGAA